MAIKFSQFSESTTTSQVDFIVGYDGNQNVRISPSNFLAVLGDYLPLTGGTLTGNLTAPAFIKTGGTSSEFLKADGTVDTNTYLTATTGDNRYVNVGGDTMTGDLEITNGGVITLSNTVYPYGKIEFGSTGGYTAYEIEGQNNPSYSKLALRISPLGTMQDAFVVSASSGSAYNYSAVPLRIGANATANELDDYEEGSWTPTINGFMGGMTGINYATQTGTYTKIGNIVHCRFNLSFYSTIGTSGNTLIFGGIPFTPDANFDDGTVVSIGNKSNVDFTYSVAQGRVSLSVIGARKFIGSDFTISCDDGNGFDNLTTDALKGSSSLLMTINGCFIYRTT